MRLIHYERFLKFILEKQKPIFWIKVLLKTSEIFHS